MIINPLYPEERAFWKQVKREQEERSVGQKYLAAYRKAGSTKGYQISDANMHSLRRRLAKVNPTSYMIWGKKGTIVANARIIIEVKYADGSAESFPESSSMIGEAA